MVALPFAGKFPRAENTGVPKAPCIPIVPLKPSWLVTLIVPPWATELLLRVQFGAA